MIWVTPRPRTSLPGTSPLSADARSDVPGCGQHAQDLDALAAWTVEHHVALKRHAAHAGVQLFPIEPDLRMVGKQTAQMLELVGEILGRREMIGVGAEEIARQSDRLPDLVQIAARAEGKEDVRHVMLRTIRA